MRDGNLRKRRGPAAILCVAALSLLAALSPAHSLARSTYRFIRYYRTLENSELRRNIWERVLVSLVLANTQRPAAKCTGVRI